MRLPAALPVLPVLLLAAACAGDSTSGGTQDVVVRVPFDGGERLVYALYEDSGALIGRGTLTTEQIGDSLMFVQRFVEAETPAGAEVARDDLTVSVEAATLRPVGGSRTVVRRAADGDASVETYSWRYEAGERGPVLTASRVRDGEREERDLRLRDHYYDNESSLWLWRTLDLSADYGARYTSVNHLERSQQTVELKVTGRVTVEVPAGEFETWRLQVRSGRATRVAWVNVDAPHQVVQWDNGSTVFRLESYEAATE